MNPGTMGKPFKTMEAARDAVRIMKTDGELKPVTVYMRGGTYKLMEPFVLKSEDSGTEGCSNRACHALRSERYQQTS